MKFLKILLESREDDFKVSFSKKFNGQQLQMIVDLAKQLPNGTKFLTFLGKTLPKNVSNELLDGKVKEYLKKFVSLGPNLPKKDINQYESIEELINSLDSYENRIRRSVQTIEGADLVYEDDRFTVVAPLTTKASCYYGAGTKWCTASSADNTQFGRYMEDGKLFYFLDKTKPTSDRFYKVALLKKFDGNETYYDAPDNSFNSGWIFGKKELKTIKQAIDNYMNSRYSEQIELYKDKEKVRLERERIARERLQRETQEHLNEAQERRENDEWSLEIVEPGSLGAMAHALFNNLVDSNIIEPLTQEDKQRKIELESKLETLQQQYDEMENADENIDLASEIEETEEELDELNNKKDVYDIIPMSTDFTNLRFFTTSDFNDTWKIGDYDTTEYAAKQSLESLIDDIGYDGFNSSFVESHIDSDKYESYLREFFEEDVYNNPESYLDDDARELSNEQENLISQLNEKIKVLFEKLFSMRDDLKTMDEDSDEYSELEELIDETETEINETEDEITEIKENPEGDYNDDDLEKVVNNIVSEYEDDISGFVNNFIGRDLTDFLRDNDLIDKSDFIDSVLDADGWGNTLNSYDGSMDEEIVNGVPYFIFYEERFQGF
jgi:hypothetical protein